MCNVKFNHKTFFTFCLLKERKMNKQNKNKTVVKLHERKPLTYLLGGETATHVNFMQHVLVYTHHA